jgi:hypothetical protein
MRQVNEREKNLRQREKFVRAHSGIELTILSIRSECVIPAHHHALHGVYVNLLYIYRSFLRRISSPRTKLLAARCECLHLIKMNCLAL